MYETGLAKTISEVFIIEISELFKITAVGVNPGMLPWATKY